MKIIVKLKLTMFVFFVSSDGAIAFGRAKYGQGNGTIILDQVKLQS